MRDCTNAVHSPFICAWPGLDRLRHFGMANYMHGKAKPRALHPSAIERFCMILHIILPSGCESDRFFAQWSPVKHILEDRIGGECRPALRSSAANHSNMTKVATVISWNLHVSLVHVFVETCWNYNYLSWVVLIMDLCLRGGCNCDVPIGRQALDSAFLGQSAQAWIQHAQILWNTPVEKIGKSYEPTRPRSTISLFVFGEAGTAASCEDLWYSTAFH